MPQSVHDIKTTGRYSVGKFKDHSQHIVYPYCYWKNGMPPMLFEYNIAEIDKYGRWETFTICSCRSVMFLALLHDARI